MKVAIITILDNTNFGTYLQALATEVSVRKCGHQPVIIRYTRRCMTTRGVLLGVLKDRGVLKFIYHLLLNTGRQARRLRIMDILFLSKFSELTDEYIGFDSLIKSPPQADVYMTGSDQVWNSYYNRGIDRSFYLDFAPDGKKRIAYAASIGMTDFPDDEKTSVRNLLQKYQTITVREKKAQSILQKLGISSDVVLDPTLLLSKYEWTSIAKVTNFDCNEQYLLTYSVEYGNEDSYIEYYAKMIAKQKGLKIYHVSYSSKSKMPKYADKSFAGATPDLFLNLMLNASFVVVASFHGTAFAINFNKQFLTVCPSNFSSRIESLLDMLELKERIVRDKSLSIEKLSSIDYSRVNVQLGEYRKGSLSKLKSIIEK